LVAGRHFFLAGIFFQKMLRKCSITFDKTGFKLHATDGITNLNYLDLASLNFTYQGFGTYGSRTVKIKLKNGDAIDLNVSPYDSNCLQLFFSKIIELNPQATLGDRAKAILDGRDKFQA
jgi:hypothetical protein